MSGGFGAFGWLGQYWLAAATSALLPTDFPDLLSWQTADEGLTVLNPTTNADLTTATLTALTLTGSIADPLGGTAAFEIAETATSTQHFMSLAWTGDTRQSTDNYFDIYVKRSPGSTRDIYVGHSTNNCLVFDLDTGQVTSLGTVANIAFGTVTSAGNGWYRVRGVYSVNGTQTALIGLSHTGTSAGVYAGARQSLYVYSPMYFQQKIASAWAPKAGSVTGSSAQATATSRPAVIVDPTLGYLPVVGHFGPIAKSLTDDPAIALAMSGSAKPFTFTWLGRTPNSTVNADWMKLNGATGAHTILATSGNYRLSMSRTDDAASTVTASFTSTDFTGDQHWHAFSVVYTGTTASLWIDGQQSPSTFPLSTGFTSLTGLVTTFNSHYIRERAIYSRALSNTERAGVENGMRSRAGLPAFNLENPLNVPGVIGYWDTDAGVYSTAGSVPSDVSGSWTPTNSTIATSGSAYVFTESTDGAPTTHYVAGNTSNVVAGSVFLTAEFKHITGGRGWAVLTGNTAANGAYINLVSGTVGTIIGTTTAAVTPLKLDADGNRWYRVRLGYTYSGSTLRIYSANGDTALSYTGTGLTNFAVRNLSVEQYRVAAWNTTGPSGWSMTQGTVVSQPFLFSGSYVTGSQIGTVPTVGENLAAGAETLSLSSFSAIFDGEDTPVSVVALMNNFGAPVGSTNTWSFMGTNAVHYLGRRVTSTQRLSTYKHDNTGTGSLVNFNLTENTPNGPIDFSIINNGKSEALYLTGTFIGSGACNVGDCTYGTSFTFNARNWAAKSFVIMNRVPTATERVALETGFKRRAGLI